MIWGLLKTKHLAIACELFDKAWLGLFAGPPGDLDEPDAVLHKHDVARVKVGEPVHAGHQFLMLERNIGTYSGHRVQDERNQHHRRYHCPAAEHQQMLIAAKAVQHITLCVWSHRCQRS